MSLALIALVLFAAALHASWNALLKSAADRAWAQILYGPIAAAMMAPFTLLVSFPKAEIWPWIVAGSLFPLAYAVMLNWAFDHGDLGEIYPISRGASPVLVTAGGAAFGGDSMRFMQIMGVITVCAGIMGLRRSGGRTLSRTALVASLLTAAATAGYTVVDGLGARASGDRYSFIVWLFLINAINSALFFWIFRRPDLRAIPAPRELVKAAATPALSMITYGMIIVATTLGPLGAISALRETSVVFAALLGWLFLKEHLSWRKVGACIAVAGAAMTALG